MMKKLGFGAAFALTAAAVAAGCSGKKTTIVAGNGTELPADQFPGTTFTSNNLAQDGGGYSNNDQTASVDEIKCTFNQNNRLSDSPNTSADGSAMIMFSVTNNQKYTYNSNSDAQQQRIYASYWSGSQFTPPTELTGQDRHESIPDSSKTLRVHVSAATMVPLNTSGYKSPGSTTGTADQLVRANSGNWLLLWDAQTATQTPALNVPDTISNSIGAADANGTHHTFYATVFLKSLASQASATSERVGNTATTGAAVSTIAPQSKVFHFGFQAVGIEVPGTGITTPGSTNRGGASALYSSVGFLQSGNRVGGLRHRYAEDVISFGVATDTFTGCAKFVGGYNGTASDLDLDKTGLQNPGNKYLYTDFETGATRVNKVGGQEIDPNDTNQLAPGSSDYSCGDDTSFIQIFWTQLVTSHVGANTAAINLNGSTDELHLGPGYRFFTANFDLASMTVKNQKTVAFTQTRNTTTGGSFGATQALPGFVTYNNTVFWRYRDASLASGNAVQNDQTAKLQDSGTTYASARPVNVSTVMSVLTVKTAANGTADIDQAGQFDVTRHGSAGKHSIANRTGFADDSQSGGSDPGNEVVSFPCSDCQTIGADEGMADLTAFVLGRSTTNTSNTDNDADTQLWALAINPSTGVYITGSTGPKRISKHLTEPFTGFGYTPGALGGTDTNLHDDVNDVKLVPARDGSYVVIGYRQAQGASSLVQNLGLMATVYKTLRTAAATVNSGSGSTVVSTTMDQRFPTTDPIQVNTPSLTAYASPNALVQGINANSGFSGSPVAAFEFQGGLDYKCGFQSDANKVSMLWLHADGTEERVFIRQLTIAKGSSATTNPTITATGTEIEFETGNTVKGDGAYQSFGVAYNPGPGIGLNRTTGSQYRFLPFSVVSSFPTLNNAINGDHAPTDAKPYSTNFGLSPCSSMGSRFHSIDAGSSGGAGDVLVVFSKVTDATTTDGDFFDQGVFAVRYSGSGGDRAAIGSNLNENRSSLSDLKSSVAALIGTPKSASLSTSQLATAGGAYVIMTVPVNDSGTSPSMVVARHFKPLTGTATAPTFPNQFFPAAGATTADATFLEPVQLSRVLNSDATVKETYTEGRRALVLIRQDNHFWGSSTTDGDSYSSKGGAPNPALADDNLSANSNNYTIQEGSCRKISTNCDDLVGSILAIVKQDVNQNSRIFIRVLR